MQSHVKGKTPTSAWTNRTGGGSNLSQGPQLVQSNREDEENVLVQCLNEVDEPRHRRKSTYHVDELFVYYAQKERQKSTVHRRQEKFSAS